jgi:SNF2 family DNA or RNA helicase
MERMRSKINDLKENSKFTLKKFDDCVQLENVDLRLYQKDGIKWLIEHYENEIGCCLCDEMGLGI